MTQTASLRGRCPLLIAVPDGLSLGGVATWACSTANVLAESGSVVGIIRHAHRAGDIPIEVALHPRVRVFDASQLPPMDAATGACGVYEKLYEQAVMTLSTEAGGLPVAAAPTQMGDCFGVFAALKNRGVPLHLLGWRHSLGAYERAVIRFYAPWLAACVAISDELAVDCNAVAPDVAVTRLPHAVEPDIEPRERRGAGGPIRLIYVGRLEHTLKRASLLPLISDALHARGIAHRLCIVGDGELATSLNDAAKKNPSLEVVGLKRPSEVRELLRGADLFLLPSRTEGLSLSLLGAMASGCVPVVTETLSGIRATVTPATGVLVPFAEGPEEQAGLFAGAICRAIETELKVTSAAARAHTLANHHPAQYLAGVQSLFEALAVMPVRSTNAVNASPWFTSSAGGGSGTVPRDAAQQMERVLGSLTGRRVLIHGTGRHTRETLHVIRAFGDRVVGYVDDDPAQAGSRFEGLMVYNPREISNAGATDVVVSSFIHQREIKAAWQSRAADVVVHVLYE